jgi:hypothetical protein
MSGCKVPHRHWHGRELACERSEPAQKDSEVFCNAPHPTTIYNPSTGKDETVARCRRLVGQHDGPHKAYVFSTVELAEWNA